MSSGVSLSEISECSFKMCRKSAFSFLDQMRLMDHLKSKHSCFPAVIMSFDKLNSSRIYSTQTAMCYSMKAGIYKDDYKLTHIEIFLIWSL